ncbi:MAG TPA: alpha/beta hydrolase [Actinospica sp.]|jgi:pimeloyl-ACP methyl ester carboxylesterase|nr:alpha/beta hydrolase [Actinospica sp.]
MTLDYEVAGDGDGVLLLHSTVCDRRMWDPQWEAFQDAGLRVARCDFRGFGRTPVPAGPYNEAEDVLEVLDAAGLDSVAVVAASHGGRVALELAARWPERVGRLALVCGGMPGTEPSAELQACWEREETCIEEGDLDAAVEVNLEYFLGPEASEATREHVRLMQRQAFDVQLAAEVDYPPTDVPFNLGDITASTLLITGEKDLPDFPRVADRLAGLLPHTERVSLPWAGHLPTLERPEELTPLLVRFLTGPHRAALRP